MIQSGGFLRRLLGPLLKTGLPLTKILIKLLAKIVLIPLTAEASAAYAGIRSGTTGSGTTTIIISNGELEDVMKIVKSLEDSRLLSKGVSESIQNEAKNKNED